MYLLNKVLSNIYAKGKNIFFRIIAKIATTIIVYRYFSHVRSSLLLMIYNDRHQLRLFHRHRHHHHHHYQRHPHIRGYCHSFPTVITVLIMITTIIAITVIIAISITTAIDMFMMSIAISRREIIREGF